MHGLKTHVFQEEKRTGMDNRANFVYVYRFEDLAGSQE